jgi:GAF domain-containing protein
VTSTLPVRLLREIAQTAQLVVGRDGAGVMFADSREVLRSVVATDPGGALLEGLQAELGEGPCLDTYVHDTLVFSDDLGADTRYPQLGPLCAAHDVGAVAGMPLHLAGGPVGAINVYGRVPRPWTDDELAVLDAYGRLVESLLAASVAARRNDELAGQLQFALDYRVVIERGIGYLMGRDGLDGDVAFDQLRGAARSSRRKVVDVAADVLEGGMLPTR